MLRGIGAIIGGLLLAFLIVFATDAIFRQLSPATSMPSDPSDSAAMAAYVATLPRGILIGIVAGWTVAVLAGSYVAARYALRGRWPGWVVGILFLLATGSNFLMIPHPDWMVTLAFAAIIIAAWIGSMAGARSTAAPPAVNPA